MALMDARTRGVQSPGRYRWWLDPQWNPIVGTVPPSSPLYRRPDWRPGAKTLAQAKKYCHLAPLTGGGTVTVTQWKTSSANSDFSCPAPPPKAKAKRS